MHIESSQLRTPSFPITVIRSDIIERYRSIRRQTEILCAPLQGDDFNLQGMDDASPPKWHLAHTTWFFETFVLQNVDFQKFLGNYKPYNPQFASLFNSYYNGVDAQQYPRAKRHLLSRPTTNEVFNYRRAIDEKMLELLKFYLELPWHSAQRQTLTELVELGLNHEQQHQELLLADLKYAFSLNPLLPRYCACLTLPTQRWAQRSAPAIKWVEFDQGLREIGAAVSDEKFLFDNETPRHRQFITAYALADRLITNGEYLDFIEDGGYSHSEWWLADGWRQCIQQQWRAPLYWHREGSRWHVFTLHGDIALDREEPVCHVSFYEADAFARWSGARLPLEYEWEHAARQHTAQEHCIDGHFVEDGILHPRPVASPSQQLRQLFGDVWEWTASAYLPYPGYVTPTGAIGEYNGKFMCNQMVLRGGSCISAREHLRETYRNFFFPADRWQFSGIRLAQSRQ